MNDQDRLEMYERVHLRSNGDLSLEEKVARLKTRRRSKWIQIIFNVIVVAGLSYGYLVGYRPFSEWIYYILGVIVVINVALLYYQARQIEELSAHFKSKIQSGSTFS